MDTKRLQKKERMSAKKVCGIIFLILGLITFFLSCFPNFLNLGRFFQGVFGVLVYPLALLVFLVGIAFIMDLNYALNKKYVAYLTISFICLIGLMHTIFTTKILYDNMTDYGHMGAYLDNCYKMTNGITVGGVLTGVLVFALRGAIGLVGTYAVFGIFATVFIGLTIDYAIYNKKRAIRREKLTETKPESKVVDTDQSLFYRENEDQMYSFSVKKEEKPPVFPGWEEPKQEEPTLYKPMFEVEDDKTQSLLEADSSIKFSFNDDGTGTQQDYSEPESIKPVINEDKARARSVLFGGGDLDNEGNQTSQEPSSDPKSARDILFGDKPNVPNIFDRSDEERNAWRRQYASKPLSYDENINQTNENFDFSNNQEPVQQQDQTYYPQFGQTQEDDGSIKTGWGTYKPTSVVNEQNQNQSRMIRRDLRENVNPIQESEEINRDFGSVQNDRFGDRNIRRNEPRNVAPERQIQRPERTVQREKTSLSNFNKLSEVPQEENDSTEFNSRLVSHENRARNNDILANASSLGIEINDDKEEESFTSILESSRREVKKPEPIPEKPKVEKISFESQLNQKYSPPPTTLLNLVKEEKVDYSQEYREKSAIIESTLSNFKIPAKVNNVVRGPKVTRYELAMPMGIPVGRVLTYEKDLSMNLASRSGVRIEAPIPGKNAFGIEVENAKPSMVGFRELVESNEFKTFKHPLPVAIGKNISGEIIVKSLGRMVHCLVAGSTGSGKSVFLHSLIVSLMYRHSPEELRFIMIDPKRVEFSRYNRMPHLMLPEVVTECSKAVNSLNWAVKEMERRYELLRVNECQKLEQFNECPAVKEGREKKLPYLVIVVDELAELMSVAAKEAESRIQRITQLGRAAGIHMVIATQRPSVDVVTGVIKNNLPTRIAFALASQVDSQTIINQAGAEKLLGQGDMLLSAQDSNAIVRLQAAFVSDEEIKKVLNYIKENNICVYDEEIQKSIYAEPEKEETSSSDDSAGGGNNEDRMDEYMPQALKLVMKNGKASISMIQRRFSVGYARAARIIDQMETRGFIDGGIGNKPRDVKITIEEYNELFGDFDSD